MDEKKKVIAMVVLFIVVIGVGAFQFSSVKGPTEDTAVKKKADEEKKLEAEKKKLEQEKDGQEILNPMFAQNLPPRDPFAPGCLPEEPSQDSNPSKPDPQPLRTTRVDPGFKPFDPGGAVPALPNAGAIQGSIGLQQGVPIRPADELAYSVKGVLLGEKPMAVFQDESGNQRLVSLGGAIDGDSRVTDISQGKVTVRHKGKTVTLTVGANANEH